MDRQILIDHLTQAERHVADGERVLRHQRDVIRDLRRDRHGDLLIDAAETLLRSFEEVQNMHVADVVRLRQELALPGSGAGGRARARAPRIRREGPELKSREAGGCQRNRTGATSDSCGDRPRVPQWRCK